MSPQITVILPALGRPEAVENALASLRRQTLGSEHFEVILVDDGSKPPLAETLDAETLEGVNLVTLTENRGPAFARNAALEVARGRITVLLNSDGILAEDALERHLTHHPEGGSPKSVMGRFDWLDEQQTPFIHMLQASGALFPYDKVKPLEPTKSFHFWTGNLSVPTGALRHVGGFDASFRHAIWEDVEIGHRLSQAGLPHILDPAIRCGHDHPFDLDTYIRRSWTMGYYWGQFAQKHGPNARPLLNQPTLATVDVGLEMLQGLLHARLDCDEHIETMRRLERELVEKIQAEPGRRAEILKSAEHPYFLALELVTTLETMRGVVAYAFDMGAGSVRGREEEVRSMAMVQFAATYEAEQVEAAAQALEAGMTLLWAVPEGELPEAARSHPKVTMVPVPADLAPQDLWKPLLAASKAGMFVFLGGTVPPDSALLKALARFLALSPTLGAVSIPASPEGSPLRGRLVSDFDDDISATTRSCLEGDAPGQGSFLERLKARGFHLATCG